MTEQITYRTTGSGYRYGRFHRFHVPPGEEFTYACPMPGCQVTVQGGRAALAAHFDVVHPDYEVTYPETPPPAPEAPRQAPTARQQRIPDQPAPGDQLPLFDLENPT